MGYYRASCSPYDVQANQGGRFTFDTVKERYEKTIPIRGKRKEQNIRPINRRDRAWERIIKVADDEYYVSYDCYTFRQKHNKAITWKASDTMEWLTIHTPRKTWNNADGTELHPRDFSSSSIYWFYHHNLPPEFGMVNYRANKYVSYNNKYYTVEKGDVIFQRKRGGKAHDWQPLIVHREFKHTLDRTKIKELREKLKPFMDYYNVMSDIVETKWEYGNLISRAIHKGEHGAVNVEQVLDLFKPTDNPPDEWLRMTEMIKHRTQRWEYNPQRQWFEKSVAVKYLEKALFAIVKPCKAEAVELGKLTNDRYKGWYR